MIGNTGQSLKQSFYFFFFTFHGFFPFLRQQIWRMEVEREKNTVIKGNSLKNKHTYHHAHTVPCV